MHSSDLARLFRRLLPLLTLTTFVSAALAGPPSKDLPDVKMPPIAKDHPRLVFRPDGKGPWTFERLRHLYETGAEPPATQPAAASQSAASQPTFEQATSLRAILKPWLDQPVDKDPSPAASALRYRLTGDEKAAQRAIGQLLDRPMEKIGSEYYSNGWEYALAYDWLYDHPSITPQKRKIIEGYLTANAQRAIQLLNDDSWELCPSMWHGRTKITNLGLVVCLALDTSPQANNLRSQIVRFFGDSCRALRLSEGWPEGYAYWLGNRSFPFALAVDCWRTATGTGQVAGIDLAQMIRRTDLWHVYGQRPDNKLLLYGDVFQGVLMNYFWRAQTMDYYARITGDPHLQAFANYGHLKSRKAYYSDSREDYRWVAALAYDPTLKMPAGSTPTDPLAGLKDLPLSDLFGAGAYNLAIFRTGWKPDDTLISFKAGDVQVHHAHPDAGTFTIYKEAPLAVLSGTYGGFGSQHRQLYYDQSVAANCPLVLMPGELLETRRHYDGPFASTGGQRVVIPTGSDIPSAAWWRRQSQPGQPYAGGKLIAYKWQPGQFGYVAADLTCAYNSEQFSWPGQKPKIHQAVRSLLWLPEYETVLVYDHIAATSPNYQKKWLLHTINKPQAVETEVLKGQPDNGILATVSKDLTVTNRTGVMNVQALLPEVTRWLLIGGQDYRFYVDTSGTEEEGFKGINADKGMNKQSYFDNAFWRAELEPTEPAKANDFLVAMSLGTTAAPPKAKAALIGRGDGYAVCQVGDTIVVFVDPRRVEDTQISFTPVATAKKEITCTMGTALPVPVNQFEPITVPDTGPMLTECDMGPGNLCTQDVDLQGVTTPEDSTP